MANNPYVNKVTANGVVIVDLTADTVTPSTLMQGYTAHDKSGALITGTASAAGGVTQDQDGYLVLSDQGGGSSITVEPLSVTSNGTYTAPTGKAYSPVTVNVSGGGGGSWELIAKAERTISHTGTSSMVLTGADVEFPASGISSDSIWCVRVRDNAGKRDGYFYGSEAFFLWPNVAASPATVAGRLCIKYSSTGYTVNATSAGTIYGVEGLGLYLASGSHESPYLTLGARYNSNYTGTIDGTYTVSIYKLALPNNETPFE